MQIHHISNTPYLEEPPQAISGVCVLYAVQYTAVLARHIAQVSCLYHVNWACMFTICMYIRIKSMCAVFVRTHVCIYV